MQNFEHLKVGRKYAMYKDVNLIFHFIKDSEGNFKLLNGLMKGHSISPENQTRFLDPEYNCIDIGEAPTVASVKVGVAKARPHTPE